jgi:hypothetical protein
VSRLGPAAAAGRTDTPPGPRVGRFAAILALVLLLLPPPAAALEPTTVSVLGTVELDPENAAAARDLALHAALVEAALEVARRFVPPAVMASQQEPIREALAEEAAGFVLTYRVEGPVGARPSRDDPTQQEFVLGLRATVDATRVREKLRTLGVLEEHGGRASIVLRVRQSAAEPAGASAEPTAFVDFLTRRLEQEAFMVVDPALRAAGALGSESALELARSLGADLALDVEIRWREREVSTRLTGGVVEVWARAFRAQDGFEVAFARFEAPAYHEDPDPDEALARALEAVQAQVAENLILQLGLNWQVLTKEDAPVQLRLLNATSLLQVDAIQHTLRNVLGADEASLVTLAPWVAEMVVRSPLSPGALQDRLVATVFDGFRLQPVEVSRRLVELRVEVLPGAELAPSSQHVP